MDSKKIPTKKKQEIVEISKNLINEKGVNNVSIRDIVKSVGMAQGLFYYYFKSKEEILEIIINEYVEAFCKELEKSVDSIGNGSRQDLYCLSGCLSLIGFHPHEANTLPR